MAAEMKARLKIVSTMTDPDGERHEIRHVRGGKLSFEGEETVIAYDDEQDGERAHIVLRAAPGRALMQRTGMTSAKLTFLPGQRTSSAYVSLYGDIPVMIDTRGVRVEKADKGGEITLDYDVYVGGERTAGTILNVTWRV